MEVVCSFIALTYKTGYARQILINFSNGANYINTRPASGQIIPRKSR